jgi:hypothetical protein
MNYNRFIKRPSFARKLLRLAWQRIVEGKVPALMFLAESPQAWETINDDGEIVAGFVYRPEYVSDPLCVTIPSAQGYVPGGFKEVPPVITNDSWIVNITLPTISRRKLMRRIFKHRKKERARNARTNNAQRLRTATLPAQGD